MVHPSQNMLLFSYSGTAFECCSQLHAATPLPVSQLTLPKSHKHCKSISNFTERLTQLMLFHVQAPKPVPDVLKQGVESVSDKGFSVAPGDHRPQWAVDTSACDFTLFRYSCYHTLIPDLCLNG